MGKCDVFEWNEENTMIIEKIAAAVHERWMEGRISEGWKYGETESLEEKTDPRICPYEELPESEKEYDRNTAETTVRALTEMGYTIVKA